MYARNSAISLSVESRDRCGNGLRDWALSFCSLFSFFRSSPRTKAARTELRGQPCANPSIWRIVEMLQSEFLMKTLFARL
eukprot:7994910-Ditylum_brightwellii.AAC.1